MGSLKGNIIFRPNDDKRKRHYTQWQLTFAFFPSTTCTATHGSNAVCFSVEIFILVYHSLILFFLSFLPKTFYLLIADWITDFRKIQTKVSSHRGLSVKLIFTLKTFFFGPWRICFILLSSRNIPLDLWRLCGVYVLSYCPLQRLTL